MKEHFCLHRTSLGWAEFQLNTVTGCRKKCSHCMGVDRANYCHGDIRLNMNDERFYGQGERGLFVLEEQFISPSGHILTNPFGFYPTFHKYRLDHLESLRNGHSVAICNLGELFGPWVPLKWVLDTIDMCITHPRHKYIFQTCYPEQYAKLDGLALLPHEQNFWYGTVINGPGREIGRVAGANTFAIFTPLIAPIDMEAFDLGDIKWAIIGHGLKKESIERGWVQDIAQACLAKGIPVYMEDNIRELMGEDFRQETPEQITKNDIGTKLKAKLFANCIFCKEEYRKKEMTALLRRGKRGESAFALGYVCPECCGDLEKQVAADEPFRLFGDSG